MSDCGEIHHFLGMKLRYNRSDGMLLFSQEPAVDRVLIKFGMQDCNSVKTPMEKGLDLPMQKSSSTTQPNRE